MPDRITIFQGPHERLSRTRAELEQMVFFTVWHASAATGPSRHLHSPLRDTRASPWGGGILLAAAPERDTARLCANGYS